MLTLDLGESKHLNSGVKGGTRTSRNFKAAVSVLCRARSLKWTADYEEE